VVAPAPSVSLLCPYLCISPGSETLSTAAATDGKNKARPRLVIATSRDFPDHERISDRWAEKLQRRGIKLFRQDETGAVTLRFGHDSWEAQGYFTGEIFRSASH
jgi:hypothetical protein